MDIDIDIIPNFDLKVIFPTAVRASMLKDERLVPHPCGVYFQNVPVDYLTKLAAIPYERAQELGALKIDFLHLSALTPFTSRAEMLELLEIEPDWTLLQIPSVVNTLFQVHAQYEILARVKPKSILELADCLALIRPQKRYLLEKYLINPTRWRLDLYNRGSGEGYGFKKAHAISYAMIIVLQLHLAKG